MMSKRFQISLTIFSLLFIIAASFGIVWDAQRTKEKNELAPTDISSPQAQD